MLSLKNNPSVSDLHKTYYVSCRLVCWCMTQCVALIKRYYGTLIIIKLFPTSFCNSQISVMNHFKIWRFLTIQLLRKWARLLWWISAVICSLSHLLTVPLNQTLCPLNPRQVLAELLQREKTFISLSALTVCLLPSSQTWDRFGQESWHDCLVWEKQTNYFYQLDQMAPKRNGG